MTEHILGLQNLNITFRASLRPMVTTTGLYISESSAAPKLPTLKDGISTFSTAWINHGIFYDTDTPYTVTGENLFRIYYNHHKQRLQFYVNGYLLRTTNIKWEYKTYYFHLLGEAKDLQITDIPLDEDIFQDDYTIAYLPFSSDLSDPCGNIWRSEGLLTLGPNHTEEGNAAQFFGNSYLQCENYITLGGEDFTVDGFVYMSSSTERQGRVFSIYEEGKGEFLALLRNNDTSQFLLCYAEDRDLLHTGGLGPHGTEDIIDKTVHFAVVYEHAEHRLTLFINSVKDISVTVPSFTKKAYRVRIGGKYSGDHKLTGMIDEFRISRTARWTEDDDLIALLRFNHYTYRDEVGTNWSLYNLPVLTTEHAYVGKALSCTGSGVYKNLFLGDTSFTVDFYGYTNLESKAPSFWSTDDIRVGLKDHSPHFCVSILGTDYIVEEAVTYGLHHFALVYDISTHNIRIFIDGIKKRDIAATLPAKIRTVRIGHSTITNSAFSGVIDDFRITRRALWKENFVLPTERLVVIHNKPVQYPLLYYNKKPQTPTFSYYDPYSTILEVEPQEHGGTYEAYFTPMPGFCWEDGTRNKITVPWTIERVTPVIWTNEKDIIMSPYRAFAQIIAYSTGTGTLLVTSSVEDVILPTISETRADPVGIAATINLYRQGYGGTTITIYSLGNSDYTFVKEEISVFSERRTGDLILDTEYAMLTANRNVVEIPYSKASTGAISYSLNYEGIISVEITESFIILTRISSGSVVLTVTVAADRDFAKISKYLRVDSIEHGQLMVATEDPETLAETFYQPGLPNVVTTAGIRGWRVLGEPYISTFNSRFGAALHLTGAAVIERSDLILGGKDFSLDFWYYLHNATETSGLILWLGNSRGWFLALGREKKTQTLCFYTGYQEHTIPVSTIPRITVLTHVAINYDHTTGEISLFLTGKKVGTFDFPYGTEEQSLTCRIGGLSFGIRQIVGAIDEFRISECIRYRNNDFVPPTQPLSLDSNTIELLHFDLLDNTTPQISSFSEEYTPLVIYTFTEKVFRTAIISTYEQGKDFVISGDGWSNISERQITLDYGYYNSYLTYKIDICLSWKNFNGAALTLLSVLEFDTTDKIRLGKNLPQTTKTYKSKISVNRQYRLTFIASYQQNKQKLSLYLDDILWTEKVQSPTVSLSEACPKFLGNIGQKNQDIFVKSLEVSII